MELPDLIPSDLSFLRSNNDEKELFDALIKNSRQLTEFFAFAADDQTWSTHHPELMQKIAEHLSQLFIGENLSMELAKKAAQAIADHASFLLPKVPKDLVVHLKEGEVEVNTLLFSTASPAFYNIAFSGKPMREIHLPKVRKPVFDIIKSYFEEGGAESLWRFEYELVLDVYIFSIEWELVSLQKEAASVLKRYLTRQNYREILILTMQKGWHDYYLEVLKVANTYDLGVVFHEMPIDFLKIEFLDYRESAMDLFEVFKPWITHLGFFGPITDDPRFSKILIETPKLIGIALNETKLFSDRLQDIPNSIEELDLSMNSWLTSEYLKILVGQCRGIERLTLQSCVNIDSKGFGTLKTLHALKALILTKCSQLKDEDILLICQCVPGLIYLDLEGCERLTDRALEIISKHLTGLEELNLSRLQITDVALIELCHRLKSLHYLNIERCTALSDKGVLEGVGASTSLKTIQLSHTPLSSGAKHQLKNIRSIKIID